MTRNRLALSVVLILALAGCEKPKPVATISTATIDRPISESSEALTCETVDGDPTRLRNCKPEKPLARTGGGE